MTDDSFLRAWIDSRAHFVAPLPRRRGEGRPSSAEPAGGTPPRRQRPSPEEVSQRSVDLLLREYYQMVKSSRSSGGAASDAPGLVPRVFLAALCHPIRLRALTRLLAAALTNGAHAVVYLSFLLAPALIAAVATLLQLGRRGDAAALAAGGLAALLLSDAFVKARAAARAEARAGAVDARSVRQLLPENGAAVVARFFPAATAAAAAAAAQQQPNPAPHSPRRAAAAAPPTPGGGVQGAPPTYEQLVAGVDGLQQLVFGGTAASAGDGAAGPGGGSARERVAAGLQRIAATAGIPLEPGALESAEGAAAALATLQKHLGGS